MRAASACRTVSATGRVASLIESSGTLAFSGSYTACVTLHLLRGRRAGALGGCLHLELRRSAVGSVRVAIIGVGNCASALVQGIHYSQKAPADAFIPRCMQT